MFYEQQNLERSFGTSKINLSLPPPTPPGGLGLGCCPFYCSVIFDVLFDVLPIGCVGSALVFVFILCVLSSFAIILNRKRELVALLS